MDIQAVVMAAGKGSRMMELTAKCPKALLPIGNRPMIWYPLNFLQRNGFKEALVVLPASHKAEIMSALNGLGDIKLHLHEVVCQQTSESGTAEVLCHVIKQCDIKSNLLVVSCDLITDASLDPLFALHYTHSSSLTLLFAPIPDDLHTSAVPGPKMKQKVERDLIGLDGSSKRLIFMTAEADCDDEQLVLRRHALNRCPQFTIHSNLLDTHVYIFNKSTNEMITNEKKSSSLKGDVIPLLTRRQFAPKQPHADADIDKRDEISQIKKMSSWIKNTNGIECDAAYCCYGYIENHGFSLRANNYATYMYANRQARRLLQTIFPEGDASTIHPTVQKAEAIVGGDCFIGKNVTIGAKSVIKGCTVGQECKIGLGVKITGCVIMDKVNIGDSCVLQGCIIGPEATLEDGCHLKDCVVASDVVTAATKSNNEIILSEGQFMDLSETETD